MARPARTPLRKHLKEPDEFVSFTRRAILFVQTHSLALVLAAGTVAVIAGALVGWQWYARSQEAEASLPLAQSEQRFLAARQSGRAEELEAALKTFQEIALQYRRTYAAGYALLLSGDALYALGRYDQAVKTYQSLLEQSALPELRALAHLGLGYSWEAKGEWQRALAAYQASAEAAIPAVRREALLGSGRTYEALKDPKKALTAYEQALTGGTPLAGGYAGLLQEKLEYLKRE